MAEITDRCTADLQAIIRYTNEIIELAKRKEKEASFEQELSSWITLYNVKAQSLSTRLTQIDALLTPKEEPKEESVGEESKEESPKEEPKEEPKPKRTRKA